VPGAWTGFIIQVAGRYIYIYIYIYIYFQTMMAGDRVVFAIQNVPQVNFKAVFAYLLTNNALPGGMFTCTGSGIFSLNAGDVITLQAIEVGVFDIFSSLL